MDYETRITQAQTEIQQLRETAAHVEATARQRIQETQQQATQQINDLSLAVIRLEARIELLTEFRSAEEATNAPAETTTGTAGADGIAA